MSENAPVRRKSVSQEVYDQMLRNISSQLWPAGSRIPPEKSLMQMYSVSRISVREAIKQLASLGLLETIQGSGTYVREYNPDMFMAPLSAAIYGMQLTRKDILDIMGVRELEIFITGQAAERSTPEGVAALRAIQEKLAQNCKNPILHVQYDCEFHLQICRMTNNPYLFEISRALYDALEKAMVSISKIMGADQAIHYHGRLIDTIDRHYISEARATMEEHLRTTVEAVENIPEEDSRFFRVSKT